MVSLKNKKISLIFISGKAFQQIRLRQPIFFDKQCLGSKKTYSGGKIPLINVN
jgi:hypothetical protein